MHVDLILSFLAALEALYLLLMSQSLQLLQILTQIVTFVFKQIKDDLIWVRHALGKTQIS